MADKLCVVFRGTKSGLVIVIDDTAPLNTVREDLTAKLEESGYFFIGADVILDVGERSLEVEELNQLQEMIQKRNGLVIKGLRTRSEATISSAKLLGLSSAVPEEKQTSPSKKEIHLSEKSVLKSEIGSPSPAFDNLPTEIVRRTLRSGQQRESNGNLVVLGDVNAGAEVVAVGDIIVFGALRGMAFAGATGKKNAIILAFRLSPTQLRIADLAARSAGESKGSELPEYASIDDEGHIVIDVWGRT